MLTVNYDRLGLKPGDRILDMGCGAGRHAFESFRRGAKVVALDASDTELKNVAGLFVAMGQQGETTPEGRASVVQGSGLELPFVDASFDYIIASEVLEHIPNDSGAVSELNRVLKPKGRIAITVPRFYPELINWALSNQYHEVPGGHVRIYRRSELIERLESNGFKYLSHHYAHGLHSPYWWLKCYVGVNRQDSRLVNSYKKFLEYEIIKNPQYLNYVRKVADPLMGKSIVFYAEKV
jgi:ubiquinone/menaquinone biosynthesis C-methylase UbiE